MRKCKLLVCRGCGWMFVMDNSVKNYILYCYSKTMFVQLYFLRDVCVCVEIYCCQLSTLKMAVV